jgi:hypothetical protein
MKESRGERRTWEPLSIASLMTRCSGSRCSTRARRRWRPCRTRIFGQKVLLPAGVIRDIDFDTETVLVDRSKDEIRNAPEFDEAGYREPAYRERLGGYYGSRKDDLV